MISWMRAGVYVVPFLPLYVSSSLLYPYVTGRNFAFRILVELLLVPLAVVWWRAPARRPAPTPLTLALVVFVGAVCAADLLGVNPTRSFWSTYERMDGMLAVLHALFFYLILRTAFDRPEHWRQYFALSIGVSALVALFALVQYIGLRSTGVVLRPGGTVGSAGVLAGYLLLNAGLCLVLVAREGRRDVTALLVAGVVLHALMIYVSGTRAALLGLGPVLLSLALVWRGAPAVRALAASRAVRAAAALGVLALLALAVTTQRIPFAESFQRQTVGAGQNPRIVVWAVAWEAVRERPWIGWGQENFYVGWNRHYRPVGEIYDRAHNAALDWLVAGGVLVFVPYLALLGAFAWTIWKLAKHDRQTSLALGAFLAAYLVFVMFWFDMLETRVLLISAMAFADGALHRPPARAAADDATPVRSSVGVWVVAAATAALVTVAIVWLNLRPALLARDAADGLNAWEGRRSVAESRAHFERAFARDGWRSPEAVERMAAIVPEVVTERADGETTEVRSFVAVAIRQLTALTAVEPVDVKHLRLLANAAGSASRLEPSYQHLALDSLTRALALSPRNEQTYAALADYHAAHGDFTSALAARAKALELAPRDVGLARRLIRVPFRAGAATEADRALVRDFLAVQPDLTPLASDYLRTGDLELTLLVVDEMLVRDPGNARLRAQRDLIARRFESQEN